MGTQREKIAGQKTIDNNRVTTKKVNTNNEMKKGLQYSWKKKKFIFASMAIFTFLLCSSNLNAQGRANVWYFGTRTGLNFGTVPPTTLSDGAINNNGVEGEGSSSICDAAGNLLFYSNGVTVWNRNHVAMTNGTGLMGNVSSTQSAVIIPRPGSTTQYYLFTAPATNTTNQVRWNVIDMSLSAGLGDVTASKNQVMPSCPTYMMEALTIVPHFNGTDYWVIAHGAANAGSSNSTNAYYVWPVTSAGVGAMQTYNVGYSLPSVFAAGVWVSQGQGITKSNTCFTKLFTSYYAQGASGLVDMVNFDNTTGVVSGPAIAINNLEDPNRVYGIEISPNDQFLYVSLTGEGGGPKRVYQFDVSSGVAATINASRYTVASAFNFVNPSAVTVDRVGQLQLGPDGKIYITLHQWNVLGSGGAAQLAAIQSPNLAGASSSYNEDEVVWTASGVGTTMGLPQFTKSFVGGIVNAMVNKTSVCAGQSVNFSYTYTGVRVTVAWDVNKDGTTDYTSDAPTHTYSTAGTYWSKVTITDNCGRTAKDSIQVTVLATAAPTGAIACGGNTMTLSSAHANCANFRWYKRVTSGATYDSLLGTGCNVPLTYSNPSQAPSSVWVEDATGETVNAALGTGPTTNYPYDKYITTFTVYAPLRLSSVRYRHNTDNPNCSTNNTITIRLGASVVYSRTFGTVAYCDPTDIPIDLTLAPGTYTIEASRTNGQTITSFSNPSIAGLITVNNDGPFYNFITSRVALCPNRVQVNRLCTLPIELIYFTGKKSGAKVQLDWATSIEIDNSHFVLERSGDGINYTPIAQIKGAGNSSAVINYSWEDWSPRSGVSYYRLIQFDLDGQSRLAGTIKVVSDNELLEVIAYPNPFNHSASVQVMSEESVVMVRLLDISGALLFEDKYFKANQARELGDNLASGVYIIQVTGAGVTKNIKLIKE